MLKTANRIILAAVASLGVAPLIMSTAQAVEVIPSLELRVNRLNGVTRILTTGTQATLPDTNGTANLDSYTIASNTATDAWVPANWTSITDLEGAPWAEVPPTAPLTEQLSLSELNLLGSKPFAFGGIFSLGSIYDMANTEEDVSFSYGLAGNVTPLVGNVVFEGLILTTTLELHVNRLTGETRIVGAGSTDPADVNLSVDLDSYTIASNAAFPPLENVWVPGNWNSITDQEGGNWAEVPPTAPLTQQQSLSELNLLGSKSFSSGDEISLGAIYDIADTEEDITFRYGLAGEIDPIVGSVVFNNDALHLRVNKVTGNVEIVNDQIAGFDFDSYVIQSASGDLNVTAWNSLENQGVTGWEEAASDSFAISELNLSSSSVLAAADTLDLGAAYQGGVDGIEDLSFEFKLESGEILSGMIEYIIAIPGDFNADGAVDGNDFLIWQGGFNQFDGDATLMDGDANGDGFVDGNDFLIWQSYFGSSSANGGGAEAVPEPGSVTLLVCGLVASLVWWRRRT